MIPWDNSTEGVIKSNKSRNPFSEMLQQIIKNVWLLLSLID